MSSDRYWRAKEIFLAALEAPLPERARRVREFCGGDEQLEGDVAGLLAEDGTGLQRPPGGLLAALALESGVDLTGARIGPFTIVRLLGEGGMGRVWAAEQDRPRRMVAVKVMRMGFASAEGVLRFRHEVEYLGRLQHPSIAQVYQAGMLEIDGRNVPYFAMELVQEARTLDEYVSAKALDLRERVELLARISEAVHHGHQRGIIHRDLKPSNVLIGPDGKPKVIDFGVACSTDLDVSLTTQRTATGELIGTLAYMSPEQCDADPAGLDVRSDVYSLGVMLYELLCGRPPYSLKGMSILAAAKVIQTHEPELPGCVDRRIRGDLEAVILKAIEKDRRCRYASAAALVDDLERWLRDEPVEVRAPGVARKLGWWIGRHPLAAMAASSAVLLVTALLSSIYLGAVVLAREPAGVTLDPERSVATLRSMTSKALASWTSGAPSGIRFASLLVRPEALGGGRLVILAVRAGAPGLPWAGNLAFFDVDQPETPLWTSAERPPDLPEGEPERPGTRFSVYHVLVADFFPELPGEEVAAAHALEPFSATSIRIYDLTGKVLYEAWHDGRTEAFAWLSTPRRLVFTAVNSERSWPQRGLVVQNTRYPPVVCALDIVAGRTAFDRFMTAGNKVMDPTVAWYRWLGPAEALAPLGEIPLKIDSSYGYWDASSSVQLYAAPTPQMGLNPLPAAFFLLDAHGNAVSRFCSDTWTYWQSVGKVPPPETYRLMDLSELPAATGQ